MKTKFVGRLFLFGDHLCSATIFVRRPFLFGDHFCSAIIFVRRPFLLGYNFGSATILFWAEMIQKTTIAEMTNVSFLSEMKGGTSGRIVTRPPPLPLRLIHLCISLSWSRNHAPRTTNHEPRTTNHEPRAVGVQRARGPPEPRTTRGEHTRQL